MNDFWMKTPRPSIHQLQLYFVQGCVQNIIYSYSDTSRTSDIFSWLSHFVYYDIDPLCIVHGYDRYLRWIHIVHMVAMICIISMDLQCTIHCRNTLGMNRTAGEVIIHQCYRFLQINQYCLLSFQAQF